MLDFLVAVAQFFCFVGLLYGAFLSLAHADCVDEMRPYYDPIAGHDWLSLKADHGELQIRVVPESTRRRAVADQEQAA